MHFSRERERSDSPSSLELAEATDYALQKQML